MIDLAHQLMVGLINIDFAMEEANRINGEVSRIQEEIENIQITAGNSSITMKKIIKNGHR